MNRLENISLTNKLINFGAIYLKNKDEQVSFVKIRDTFGFRLPAMSKIVELANLVPEDEFITISKDDCSADGRDIFDLRKLECRYGSNLVMKTSLSFPIEIHKKIVRLLESKNTLSYDIKKFVKEYQDNQMNNE